MMGLVLCEASDDSSDNTRITFANAYCVMEEERMIRARYGIWRFLCVYLVYELARKLEKKNIFV